MIDKDECQKYILSITEIATYKDSKSIQQFLCEESNMERLGRYDIKDKIDIILWESKPTHKREFTSKWNKRWKNTLGNHKATLLD